MKAATKLSETPLVHPTATIEASTLGRYTEVAERTAIRHSSFGDYSYIMADGDILNSAVGKFCSFASDVRLNPPNHPMHRASQHHFTYRAGDYFADAENDHTIFAWRQARPVTVGHDVWIGHGATLMPGVSVGTGAAIGAGSVVTKDVPSYAIVAGVPARLIRMRFPDEVAARLLALAWWDLAAPAAAGGAARLPGAGRRDVPRPPRVRLIPHAVGVTLTSLSPVPPGRDTQ